MRKPILVMTMFLMAGALAGCETVKYTVAGPFIGMKKDIDNAKPVVAKIHPVIAVEKTDDWIRRNMW